MKMKRRKQTSLEVKLVSQSGVGTMRFACDLTVATEDQMTNRMFVISMAMARAEVVLNQIEQLDRVAAGYALIEEREAQLRCTRCASASAKRTVTP